MQNAKDSSLSPYLSLSPSLSLSFSLSLSLSLSLLLSVSILLCLSVSPFPSPGDLPNPGIEPRSPAFQTDSLPSEPQGKPNQNTEVGCHAFLHGIFLTQGSNSCLPFKKYVFTVNWRIIALQYCVVSTKYQHGSAIIPVSLVSPALTGKFFTTSATWEAFFYHLPLYFFLEFYKSL